MRGDPLVNTLELPDGLRLPYAESGDPDGMPVLLLHGYTDSWRSFAPLLAALPPHLRAIALSQRGHGEASRPASGYAPGDYAADLAGLVRALGLGPALVVGHCLGAQVAQRFALDHPGLVRGLVLIGAYRALRGNPVAQALWEEVAILADPVAPGFAREFQAGTLARPVPPAFLDTVVRESLKLPARVWRAALAGALAAGIPPGLGQIRAPTLLLWGDRDALIPQAEQEALAAAIPGARRITHPGGGHAPHWEDPARVAAEIAGFAASLAREAATAA
jgi:pimeloyl-ACP methyl ester carboxylesterase